jgi:GT2 family glycosyltransferase
VRISVVIPVRDRIRWLPAALDSVFAQTSPADEIIVVDDGSGDRPAALVERRYPAVTVIVQPPAGVSTARNRGIAAARHDWIALLDSDDEWLPDKLARQRQALAAGPDHLLCHTDEIWIRRGRRVNPGRRHAKHGGRIFRHCLALCAISPSAVLFHRGLLDQCGWFDETLPACEDYDLWLRICARHPVLFVAETLLIKHGGHEDQLSLRYPAMDRFRIRALERLLDSVALDDGDRAALLEVLIAKLGIYGSGAGRRGRGDVAMACERRQRVYRRMLNDIAAAGARRPDPGLAAVGVAGLTGLEAGSP